MKNAFFLFLILFTSCKRTEYASFQKSSFIPPDKTIEKTDFIGKISKIDSIKHLKLSSRNLFLTSNSIDLIQTLEPKIDTIKVEKKQIGIAKTDTLVEDKLAEYLSKDKVEYDVEAIGNAQKSYNYSLIGLLLSILLPYISVPLFFISIKKAKLALQKKLPKEMEQKAKIGKNISKIMLVLFSLVVIYAIVILILFLKYFDGFI